MSDAPSDASPNVLRASKKLCVRVGCLSLINAAGGASSALVGARLVLGRALVAAGSVGTDSASEDLAAVAMGMSVAFVAAALGDSGNAVAANRSGCNDVGTLKDSVVLASEEAEAAIGADAVESDIEGEAGVEVEAGVGDAGLGDEERDPRSSVADADAPKNANTMAHAMANFTSPPAREREMPARTIECGFLREILAANPACENKARN